MDSTNYVHLKASRWFNNRINQKQNTCLASWFLCLLLVDHLLFTDRCQHFCLEFAWQSVKIQTSDGSTIRFIPAISPQWKPISRITVIVLPGDVWGLQADRQGHHGGVVAVLWRLLTARFLGMSCWVPCLRAASLWVLSTTVLCSSSGESTLDRSMLEDERPDGWSSWRTELKRLSGIRRDWFPVEP